MENFSIDEVAGTFSADVSSRLGEIDIDVAKSVQDLDSLAAVNLDSFLHLERHSHTLAGTSALINVESLAECSRTLEHLANASVHRTNRIKTDLRWLREVSGIFAACGGPMREMLALELQHRSADSSVISKKMIADVAGLLRNEDWLEELEHGDAEGVPALYLYDDADEYSFEGGPTSSVPSATVELQPAASKPANPMDAKVAEEEEYSFEENAEPATATPAAQIAAQPPLSAPSEDTTTDEYAFDNQTVDEAKAELSAGTTEAEPADVDSVRDGAADALPATQSASVFFVSNTDEYAESVADGEVDESLKEIFKSELLQLLEELTACFATLTSTLGTAGAVDPLQRLERIFHTVKGSAASVGLLKLSHDAAELESSASSAGEGILPMSSEYVADLFHKTNDVLSKVGLTLKHVPTAAPDVPAFSGELSSFFATEATEIFYKAATLLDSLAVNTSHPDVQRCAQFEMLLHHLSGSAVMNDAASVTAAVNELRELSQSFDGSDSDSYGDLFPGMRKLATALNIEWEPAVMVSLPALPTPPASASSVFIAVESDDSLSSMHTNPELLEAFAAETQELLEELDRILLELESTEETARHLPDLFRMYHTLKSAFYTGGLNATGSLIHRVESTLEVVAKMKQLPPARKIVSVLLDVQVEIRNQLHNLDGLAETQNFAEIDAALAALLVQDHQIVSAKPNAEIELAATLAVNPKIRARLIDDEGVQRRYMRIPTERLDGLMNLAGELVVNRTRMVRRTGTLRSIQRELAQNRNRLLRTVDSFREHYEFSLLARRQDRRELLDQRSNSSPNHAWRKEDSEHDGQNGDAEGPASSPAEHLFTDLEMDRYDDINIFSRSLAEISNDFSELQTNLSNALDNFAVDSDAFNTIVSGLQSQITHTRMVSLEQTFLRLKLAARDAAEREGKQVDVVSAGQHVNLDKTILDQLYVPLQHLVRNGVCHGIESSPERIKNGKSSAGVLTLAAKQESGFVVIDVSDDGRGLDLRKLHALGVKRRLISESTPIDHPSVAELAFISGLSTRNLATDVAGRGVGCDVVRAAIERMNGTVTVISEESKGATFRITLPLTLTITRALFVRVCGNTYAIPLNYVEGLVSFADTRTMEMGGRRVVEYNGAFIRLLSLSALFGTTPETVSSGALIVVKLGGELLALRADSLLSQEEIVIKNIGPLLDEHPFFTGVTPDADGQLILILNIVGIFGSRNVARTLQPVQPQLMAPEVCQRRTENGARRVLFVDDSVSVRRVAERYFDALGIQVLFASNGVEGLKTLRGEFFDAIFTDLEMPLMGGYELMRELRSLPEHKDTPVLVVSSRSGEKHRQRAQSMGFCGFISKPFSRMDIARSLSANGVIEAGA